MAEAPVEVLLVDDSAIVRGLIARGLESDPDIRVIGSACDGKNALAMLDRLSPRVVVLDVEMPVMNGLEALPKIMAKRPGVKVIMASALTRRHAAMSLKALELGAADYVPKPEASGGTTALTSFFEELRAKIKILARAKSASSPRAIPNCVSTPAVLHRIAPAAFAIGSSTGGPPALQKVCKELRGALTAPLFITQHMPATFTAMLAEQLGKISGVPAFEAEDKMPVRAGMIYVAPGGKHMLVDREAGQIVIRLSDDAPEHFCKPAVDPMLRSLASVYGSGLLAVILTGMGRDGADGCVAVADAGGHFIVQDEASSVVYGMPGAALKTGRAAAQLSLDEIATLLARGRKREI
jgi:two-component system chemotaxis response regulator CheB